MKLTATRVEKKNAVPVETACFVALRFYRASECQQIMNPATYLIQRFTVH
jgi:hypothetical protein